MASIWPETAAWIGLPLVLLLTAVGVGLLVERAAGLRLPGALIAPVGACGCIVLAMPVAWADLGSPFATALVLVAAVAGVVLHRRDWRTHARRAAGGWAGLAALAVFGLYLAPTALTGHWTWSGYNFVNDTAFQFLLTDWVRENGMHYEPFARSTTSETVRVYLSTRYPLGSHAHLGMLSTILGVRADIVYAAYISGLVALTAMALAALARHATGSARWAAAVAFVAAAASLTYHYALQGNIKEMAMLMAVATAIAAGRELLGAERPERAVLATAVPLAAAISVYYAAALPYVATIGGALLVGGLVAPVARSNRRRLPVGLLGGAVAVAVLAVPALTVIGQSLFVLRGTLSAEGAASAGETLAHLVRPLPLYQLGGVWLDGDYRVPVAGSIAELLTTGGLVLVFALGALGLAYSVRRWEPGPPLLLGVLLLVYLVLAPRTSPYSDAKMLALLSPAVVFCGMVGAASVARRLRAAGVGLAAVVGVLVLGSAAFAYHDTKLAPIDRMADIEDLGDRYAGSERLMLFNEYEEFAKYYMRDARINVPTEALTEAHIDLREGGDWPGRSFDLDQIEPAFVQRYPAIVVRRKPTGSRPPANYRFEYQNRSYAVWERTPTPRIVEHMAIQGPDDALAQPDCTAVRDLASRAEEGMALVAAVGPEIATYDFFGAPDLPAGWNEDLQRPGELVLGTPGIADGTVAVEGGRYQVWLEGTFGRPMHVSVDGEPIGAAEGVNTPSGWLRAGSVELSGGEHDVQVRRPGGNLEPGDGARSSLGAVALVAEGETELIRVDPADAESLCGRELDWIELVAAPAG